MLLSAPLLPSRTAVGVSSVAWRGYCVCTSLYASPSLNHRSRTTTAPPSRTLTTTTSASSTSTPARPSLGPRPSRPSSSSSLTAARAFSTSRPHFLREIEFKPDGPFTVKGKTAWPHPIYSPDQLRAIEVAHREPQDFSDRVALLAVKVLRTGLDFASGYRHDKAVKMHADDPEGAVRKYAMNEHKYLTRNIFLESVAGVPGMVAGMLRHLRSMRRMRRDYGWIETLLEESVNERMHLLIFLKMAEPGPFMRMMVLLAQGVFFNAMFLSYILSPRTCHRFVGYLEEEAVITYSREIADIEAGKLPKWADMEAPQIAIDYYGMPEGHRSMKDLLLYIRADEAKHREVNHTLGNLVQNKDPNPYVYNSLTKDEPHPTKGLQYQRPSGWAREEVFKDTDGLETKKFDQGRDEPRREALK